VKYVGLWLDHKKAVVIKSNSNQETKEVVHSKLSPSNKAKHLTRVAPKKHEEKREHIITQFYGEVFKTLTGADRVFLMGPGIAKKEFGLFLKQKDFQGKVVEVTNADKMTDRQVAAQTRNFFGLG